jgi:hypothetical protein
VKAECVLDPSVGRLNPSKLPVLETQNKDSSQYSFVIIASVAIELAITKLFDSELSFLALLATGRAESRGPNLEL